MYDHMRETLHHWWTVCTKSAVVLNSHELLDLPVDHWSQINGYDVTHALVSSISKVWDVEYNM
jgi:hypothetical protein